MSNKLLRISQVEEKIGFKKTFIYKEIAEGRFPPQIKAGKCSRWRESDIDDWINKLVASNANAA